MEHKTLAKAEEKFLFHMNNFDDEIVEEDVIEEEPPPPPPPMFSEAELERAKEEAYASGHAKASKAAQASRSRYVADTLSDIGRKVDEIFAQEKKREETYEHEAVTLCLSVFKKLFPVLTREHGLEELKHQISRMIAEGHGISAIEVRVHPDHKQAIDVFLAKLVEKKPDLRFTVVDDTALGEGSAHLSWVDGGAVRSAETISEQILHRIEELLAGSPAKRHDDGVIKSNLAATDEPEPDLTADNDAETDKNTNDTNNAQNSQDEPIHVQNEDPIAKDDLT